MSLALLHSFIQALAHKTRTPLSVVQNELSYLKSKVGEAECKTALEACARMAGLLKETSRLLKPHAELRRVELQAILAALEGHEIIEIEGDRSVFGAVKADAELLASAFSGLFEFLKSHIGISEKIKVRYALTVPNEAHIAVSFEPAFKRVADKSSTALSSFFTGYDSVLLPVADAIISEHGWRLNIRSEGGAVSAHLLIPFEK